MNTPALLLVIAAFIYSFVLVGCWLASAIRYTGRDGRADYNYNAVLFRPFVLLILAFLADTYL